MAEGDISVMDIPCIRTIIDYKWNTHTFEFFFKQLIAMLIFYISFVVDLYYWMHSEDKDQLNAFIVTRVICGLVVIYFFIIEVR